MVRRESRSSTKGHITLGTKQTGAPSAGNPHAGCDVAGAGKGFTVWLFRDSQRERGTTGEARPLEYRASPRPDRQGFTDFPGQQPQLSPTGLCLNYTGEVPENGVFGKYVHPVIDSA